MLLVRQVLPEPRLKMLVTNSNMPEHLFLHQIKLQLCWSFFSLCFIILMISVLFSFIYTWCSYLYLAPISCIKLIISLRNSKSNRNDNIPISYPHYEQNYQKFSTTAKLKIFFYLLNSFGF